MFKKVLICIFSFAFCYSIFACWAEQCTCPEQFPNRLPVYLDNTFNLTKNYNFDGKLRTD